MGFDIYGMNPKVNTYNSQEYDDIMMKYGDGQGWIDWSKDIPQATKDRYFELKDQHYEDNPGQYFRNNVWFWRPLWDFVCNACDDFLTDKDMDGGHSNGGHKISKTKANRIAKRLNKHLKSGLVDELQKEAEKRKLKAIKHNAKIEAKLEQIKLDVKELTGKDDLVPRDYPEKMYAKWTRIYNTKDWNDSYPFSKENIENFAKFCEQSGGFEIC
tara:strand:+ start:634 stop:1275 length:642 start_codon:yes stop_codon:yes gene_type:complete